MSAPVQTTTVTAPTGAPNGDQGGTATTTGQQQPTAVVTTAPVVPPGATIAGQQQTAPAGQVPTWYADGPDAAQAYVERVTREAAGHRVAKQELEAGMNAAIAAAVQQAQGEWSQNIGKALGLVKDDAQQLTPEQLTEQFSAKETSYQQQIRELTISNALATALIGAQPAARDALIGSGKLRDLDPTADDFTTKLQERVTEYLDAHPYFKTTPVVVTAPLTGTTGGDMTGTQVTPPGGEKTIDELRAERAKRRTG